MFSDNIYIASDLHLASSLSSEGHFHLVDIAADVISRTVKPRAVDFNFPDKNHGHLHFF